MDPAFDLKTREESVWGYIGTVAYVLIDAVFIYLIILQSWKIYQDLYTMERKSLDHRRKKPKITLSYKLNLYLSLIMVIISSSGFFVMLATYLSPSNHICTIKQKFAATLGLAGKIAMYYVFLVRLHSVYNQSAYAYSVKSLKISAILITVYSIFVLILVWILWESEVYGYNDGVDTFPNYCEAAMEYISGGLYVLGDTVASFGFLYAFIKPLRKTVKAVQEFKGKDEADKQLKKILYAGTKTVVITSCAIGTTFFISFISSITDINFFVGIDSLINSICVLLLTPYYNEETYKLLCSSCIFCCDRNKYSKSAYNKQNGDKNDNEKQNNKDLEPTATSYKDTRTSLQDTDINTISPTSADTMDQLKKTGQELNIHIQNNYQSEVTPEPPSKDDDDHHGP